jgi:hypothetical protein
MSLAQRDMLVARKGVGRLVVVRWSVERRFGSQSLPLPVHRADYRLPALVDGDDYQHYSNIFTVRNCARPDVDPALVDPYQTNWRKTQPNPAATPIASSPTGRNTGSTGRDRQQSTLAVRQYTVIVTAHIA